MVKVNVVTTRFGMGVWTVAMKTSFLFYYYDYYYY